MKHHLRTLITLAAVFILSSCNLRTYYTEYVGFVDYSSYLKRGVFLTESNSVSFDYDAIGTVSAIIYSGYIIAKQDRHIDQTEIYSDKEIVKNEAGQWKEARPDDALAAAVAQAVEKGGDGLINIKITPTSVVDNAKYKRSGFMATGMAIKRK